MAEALTAEPIKAPHGFFTRRGGVSSGAFASLNCSLSSPDDPAAVLENRARVARSLGAEPSALVGLTQVHGTQVVTVTQPWAPGQGEKADAKRQLRTVSHLKLEEMQQTITKTK